MFILLGRVVFRLIFNENRDIKVEIKSMLCFYNIVVVIVGIL